MDGFTKAVPSEEEIVIRDRRFHQLPDGTFVPRVTSITGMWPKDEGFERWLGDSVSYDAAMAERDRAAEQGTRLHKIIAILLEGKIKKHSVVITKDDSLTFTEWKKLVSFVQFMKDWLVEPIAVEKFLSSEEYKTAGTADLVAKVTHPKTSEIFTAAIDWKTGSSLHHGHKIQVMMYGAMHEPVIDHCLLVRLGSLHKCGYEVWDVRPKERKELLEDWQACYHLFVKENGQEPHHKSYPSSITI